MGKTGKKRKKKRKKSIRSCGHGPALAQILNDLPCLCGQGNLKPSMWFQIGPDLQCCQVPGRIKGLFVLSSKNSHK